MRFIPLIHNLTKNKEEKAQLPLFIDIPLLPMPEHGKIDDEKETVIVIDLG
jgi:hypothetical protein